MTDDSGIFEELHAEREELERMFKVAKDIIKEEIILSSSPFFSLEEKEGKLLITGIALTEGVWKNVLYPADEIEKSASALAGKSLLVEHGLDSYFERKEVGKVKKAYYDKALKSIVFQAEVTDPKAIEMVKDGTFPAVSCSTWVDKFPINQEQSIGFNFNFNELSLVRTPACEKCFIFAVEELSKKIHQEKEDLNNQSPQVTKQEVNKMTEEFEEVIEELEEEEIELSEIEEPKMYAVVEAESLSDFDEELAKKVVSYYYGYRYPYGYYKYPYAYYPYYPYYPYYKQRGKSPYKKPEKKSLWALFELESPEEIETLRKKGKKVVAVYYGYYGYPYYKYPYYGKRYYPYYYYRKKKKTGLAIVEDETGKEEEVEFDTMEELDELAKKKKVKKYYYEYPYKYPEKKAEESKCPEGQIYDEKEGKCMPAPEEKAAEPEEEKCPEGQEYDPEAKKCVEKISEELIEAFATLDELALSADYIAFMKKCMKESKTMPVIKRMKECAEAFKKQVKPEEKTKQECPEGQIWDEKEQKCMPLEGKEKYPVPASATEPFKSDTPAPGGGREFTDMKPGEKITAPEGPAEHGKAIAAKVEMAAETVKKEELPGTPTEETPMAQEPCKECPKKEEEKATTPEKATEPATQVAPKAEETKSVEAPKEEPKEPEKPKEEAKVEPKKEEPKVEAPKAEEKKPEEPSKEAPKEPEKKEPTKEEIEAYVREHWTEILHKLAKEKKF